MGKKTKTGKGRLDKYYHLAKEQGYRARSAFKLIQLTQKNDIFSGCRSLLDLCAAPGGWLQVAQKNMPVASTIVGVDLAPIKTIRGVTTIQADITTQRCRNLLKQELPDGSCDVVLHDGAPNVGASWVHDAYAQNELVLHATKLACEFLRGGGTYITKVFRSQDYASLLWVFQQLFNRCTATKPSSSRNVSAEIFVICQGFKNPPKIDPKFFDPKFVFINTEQAQGSISTPIDGSGENKRGLSELVKAMGKKNRGGYNEGDDHRVSSVTEFFEQKISTPAEFITTRHQLIFPEDDLLAQRIRSDPSTNEDILQYCEDLKVLGKREYSILIKWRFKLLKKWANESQAAKDALKKPVEEEADSETERMEWERELVELSEKMKKQGLDGKRKLREKLKKLKFQREMSLGAFDAEEHDPELFDLKGMEALEEEDEVLERSGLLEKIAEMSEGGDESDEEDEFSESEGSEKEEDEEELDPTSKLAIDLEILAEMEKERKGNAALKRELKKKKETRRQQVFNEWSREIDALSGKLSAENLDLKTQQVAEKEESSDEDDDVPDATEYKLMEDEDRSESDHDAGSDGGSDEDEVLKAALSNKKGAVAVRSSEMDRKAQEVLNKYRTNRWFDQEMFKDVGVTLEDLEKEDQLQNMDDRMKGKDLDVDAMNDDDDDKRVVDSEGIHELSDSELPQIPMTEKQKRREKRKREQEKKDAKDARKRAKTSKVGPLGVPVDADGDKDLGFEEVPINYSVETPTFGDGEDEEGGEKKYRPETPEEVAEVQAIGSLLSKRKSRMDLIDGAYNRYAFNDDECVPEWFGEDEENHNKPELPITKELMRQYRAKIKEISERPIRKVLEATGRKKMRLKKRLERVKRQAESISESSEHTEFSKAKTIRKLINKAKRGENKKEKSYIVSHKQGGGSQVGKGAKGPVKVVDRRLKSDKRGKRAADKRNKKRK